MSSSFWTCLTNTFPNSSDFIKLKFPYLDKITFGHSFLKLHVFQEYSREFLGAEVACYCESESILFFFVSECSYFVKQSCLLSPRRDIIICLKMIVH